MKAILLVLALAFLAGCGHNIKSRLFVETHSCVVSGDYPPFVADSTGVTVFTCGSKLILVDYVDGKPWRP